MDKSTRNDNPSIEQILHDIRTTLNERKKQNISSDDDVFELTNMITEDGSVVTIQKSSDRVLASKDNIGSTKQTIPKCEDKNTALTEENYAAYQENKCRKNANNHCSHGKSTIIEQQDWNLETIVSNKCANEISEPLNKLVDAVSTQILDESCSRNYSSVEDLVIELMKPKLSEWLDKNLPDIVKEIVEREISQLVTKTTTSQKTCHNNK